MVIMMTFLSMSLGLCVCVCMCACSGIDVGSVKAYEKEWWRKAQLPYQKKTIS